MIGFLRCCRLKHDSLVTCNVLHVMLFTVLTACPLQWYKAEDVLCGEEIAYTLFTLAQVSGTGTCWCAALSTVQVDQNGSNTDFKHWHGGIGLLERGPDGLKKCNFCFFFLHGPPCHTPRHLAVPLAAAVPWVPGGGET